MYVLGTWSHWHKAAEPRPRTLACWPAWPMVRVVGVGLPIKAWLVYASGGPTGRSCVMCHGHLCGAGHQTCSLGKDYKSMVETEPVQPRMASRVVTRADQRPTYSVDTDRIRRTRPRKSGGFGGHDGRWRRPGHSPWTWRTGRCEPR